MTVTDERRAVGEPADAAELGERLAEVVTQARAEREAALAEVARRYAEAIAPAGELVALAYERGYKLAPLARRLGVTRNALYGWMGRKTPGRDST